MAIAILAVISGADSSQAIETFGQAKLEKEGEWRLVGRFTPCLLEQLLGLKKGVEVLEVSGADWAREFNKENRRQIND